MKKRFITNLALLIILNLLIKPFWFFGIEVGVQNRVGEEMYGFYFSLFNFAFILNILLDLGINNFNNRAIARNHDLLEDHLSAIIPLKFFLAVLYAAVVFLAGKLVGYTSLQYKMLWLLVLNQFLASFILYLRTNISGLQLFRTDSLLSVLDRTLMILFTGLLLWGNIIKKPFQIEWFVYAQTASYTLTALVTGLILRSRSGCFKLKLNQSDTLKILRQSYPFALLILMMSLFNRIDSVMLERLLENGKEEAGIYAQSFRILDAASQFALLFATLLLPMFSRMLGLRQNVNDLLRIALPILLVAGISLAVSCNYYSTEIIDLLYVSYTPYSAKIFSILIIGFVFISTSYIFGTLLTANKNLRHLNMLAGITVFINITLNLLLIPRFHAVGAAIASLCSQAFYALMQVILSIRLIGVPLNTDLFLKLSGFLAFNMLTGYFTLQIPSWLAGFSALLLSCLLSAWLFHLIKPLELWGIITRGES